MADTNEPNNAPSGDKPSEPSAAASAEPNATAEPSGASGQGEGTGGDPPVVPGKTILTGAVPEGKQNESAGGEAKAQESGGEIQVKLPEGVEAPQEFLDETVTFAKEHGLSSDAAQALVEARLRDADTFREASDQKWASGVKQWEAECRSDPEFGGTKFAESAADSVRVIERYGDKELRELLDDGMGMNPALFRWSARIGKAMRADSIAVKTAGGAPPKKVEGLADMYDDMTQ